jgi:hypothetical protein
MKFHIYKYHIFLILSSEFFLIQYSQCVFSLHLLFLLIFFTGPPSPEQVLIAGVTQGSGLGHRLYFAESQGFKQHFYHGNTHLHIPSLDFVLKSGPVYLLWHLTDISTSPPRYAFRDLKLSKCQTGFSPSQESVFLCFSPSQQMTVPFFSCQWQSLRSHPWLLFFLLHHVSTLSKSYWFYF